MNLLMIWLIVLTFGGGQSTAQRRVLFKDNFNKTFNTRYWFVEKLTTPHNQVEVRDGQLVMDVSGGATVWLTKELGDNWRLDFDRTVVVNGGVNDRLSDFNMFWQAKDPRSTTLWGRNPAFEQYDSLLMYYVGFGGNHNTTTRFRKYQGNGERTLLAEYTNKAHLLEANKTYHCRIEVRNGETRFYINDTLFFQYKDPDFLQKGYLGFRTTQSRQQIDNVRITRE
ncbi:MAG: DUF6250 domain-containing protein [Spirosomataceae bacterium]